MTADPHPIVLDTSVVVAWFVPEALTPVAEQLMASSYTLIAPRFLLMEVAGALMTQTRRGHFSSGKARAALSLLRSMAEGRTSPRISLHDDDPLFDVALIISERERHAFYDCMFLALAQRESARLATFDKALERTGRALSIPLWAAADTA